MEASIHSRDRQQRFVRGLRERLANDPCRNAFDLREEQVAVGGGPGLDQLVCAVKLFGCDRPRLLGGLAIRDLAGPLFSVGRILDWWLTALRGVRASADKIQGFVTNRCADVGMDLRVTATVDSIISNDAEELFESPGDDVVTIGLAQVSDGPEDGRPLSSHPGSELLPSGRLVRPTALEQAVQLTGGFSGRHRAVTEQSPTVPSTYQDAGPRLSFPSRRAPERKVEATPSVL